MVEFFERHMCPNYISPMMQEIDTIALSSPVSMKTLLVNQPQLRQLTEQLSNETSEELNQRRVKLAPPTCFTTARHFSCRH